MTERIYSSEQMNDLKRCLEIIASVPPEKRFLVSLATVSFINGMLAQDRLANQTPRPGG